MTLNNIWVFAQVANGAPTSATLELLTKARSLSSNVTAIIGGDGASAAALGEFGATKVYAINHGASLPGVAIAAALKTVIDGGETPDLIIGATESSDGYTGTVPEQIAELLGLPSVTFAKKVSVEGGVLKVDRQTENGYDEVTCALPALISVTAGVVEPRYPSFKGIMAAKSKPVEEVTAADLGITPVGWAGAGQKISNVAQAEARQAGEIIEDDGESFGKIIGFLENLKVI